MISSMERVKKILFDDTFRACMDEITVLEADRRFCRHGMDHLENVARIAWILALEEGKQLRKDVVYGAALLHDIGRSRPDSSGQPHRIFSAEIADEILIRAGYTEEEREDIRQAILSHGGSFVGSITHAYPDEHTAENLADVIYRADKLSRDCFLCGAYEECYWEEDRKNKTIIV